ncbi:hypothetical protein ACERK3_11715 [Phycisphaerales bacterium AB-hyl4]|uniref:Fibronectin type-III domain-containing protein n=1 Tax=Natronomicrosphaera hydrolytica TaxID=3242702 RepID=A0ABV4U5R8_9BACT
MFLPLHRDDAVAEDQLSTVPAALKVNDRTVEPQTVTPGDGDVFDFVPLFGGLAPGNTAYVFLEIESGSAQQVSLGMGADWWMQAWVNGKEVVNTIDEGNEHWPPSITDHVVNASLQQGTNVLAIKFISGSGSSRLAVGGPAQLRDASRDRYSAVDPSVQGLDAFMERHGVKPYDLFFEDDGLRTHRLIFEDVEHGTPIWMVDDAPFTEHTTTSSVWSAWNANASRLFVPGHRPTKDGDVMRGGLVNADYSRIQPRLDDSRHPIWAPDDPDVYYLTFGGTQLREINEAKGTRQTIAQWDQSFTRSRIYGLTKDSRYVFLDTPNGGIWMPYEPGNVPLPDTGLNPGRPARPQADGNPSHPLDNHEFWRPHTSVSTNHEEWGPIVRVRVGMLIDRETGEIDHVIAPLEGNEAYLRLFMGQNGHIKFPEGERWEKYRIHRGDTVDEMQEIYNYYPTSTHGHQDASPDGEFIVRDGMAARFWRTRTGTPFEEVKVSSDGEYYHMHWSIHPRFYVGWIRGWHFRTFDQTNNGNIVYQGFSDGTWQPVFNTHHRFNGYYAGGDFSMQSPDATKIHTASSMTGRFRNYVAVMARPRPPEQVQWQADEQAVELTWEPSAYSNETRGYLVYRSTRSGDEYVLQTHEPIEQTTWRDEDVEPGQDYYYVVTALEYSGLESGFSMEAARAGVDLPADVEDRPLVVYVEPEHAVRDLYTDERPGLAIGRDVREASDWYYLYRHPDRNIGAASMSIELPAAGDYHLWARVRSNRPDNVWTRVRGHASQNAGWRIKLGDGTHEARTDQKSWTWVRTGQAAVTLSAGEVQITFETVDAGAEIDLIALSTDEGFEPEGRRPEIQTPPQSVQSLEADNRRERVNELRWSASDDPSFAHYHVYASRAPFKKLTQQHRIGSPTEARFTDWGLRAGVTYHYAVTVVDRWGNESEPTFAQVSTPSRDHEPVHLELAFADAERQGPFEESTAGGLRGSAYLVPERPRSNRVSWRITIPHEGEYFLWLRYLHRGSGMRGNETDNDVRVRLGDDHIATLGGRTDLNVPDRLIDPDHPMAEQFWTWAVPGDMNLEAVRLPAGEHTLTLDNLNGEIRYDMLLITDEPAYRPADGRLRQR